MFIDLRVEVRDETDGIVAAFECTITQEMLSEGSWSETMVKVLKDYVYEAVIHGGQVNIYRL